MTKPIKAFRGKYAFLSNFHPCQVELEGKTYPTVEHAFQAAKTDDPEKRKEIQQAPTPAKAKKLGWKLDVRKNWQRVKTGIMRDLVRQKFTNNKALRRALLDTGSAKLVEVNNWNDTFWGVCRGKGKNMLGKILMEVREELSKAASEGAPEETEAPPVYSTDPWPICPKCGSKRFSYEDHDEYSGGVWAWTWTVFTCKKCKNVWETEQVLRRA